MLELPRLVYHLDVIAVSTNGYIHRVHHNHFIDSMDVAKSSSSEMTDGSSSVSRVRTL
jgi:hypothetical protein